MTSIIYCDYCSWKLVVRDFSECSSLKEVSSNGDNKKFKCPSCGRVIQSKKIPDSQKQLEIKLNKEKHSEEYKKWIEDMIKERTDYE